MFFKKCKLGTAVWATVSCNDFVVFLTCFTDHLSGLIKLMFDEVHLDPPDSPHSVRNHQKRKMSLSRYRASVKQWPEDHRVAKSRPFWWTP